MPDIREKEIKIVIEHEELRIMGTLGNETWGLQKIMFPAKDGEVLNNYYISFVRDGAVKEIHWQEGYDGPGSMTVTYDEFICLNLVSVQAILARCNSVYGGKILDEDRMMSCLKDSLRDAGNWGSGWLVW